MSVKFTSHAASVLTAEEKAKSQALEMIGGMAESYAKKLCPVDTGNLRNSITHQRYDESTEVVGSNVEYAPYVELGTVRMKARPGGTRRGIQGDYQGHYGQLKARQRSTGEIRRSFFIVFQYVQK